MPERSRNDEVERMEKYVIEISSIEELVELVCQIPDGVILELELGEDGDGDE